MFKDLIETLTNEITSFVRIKGITASDDRGHLSFAGGAVQILLAYLYRTLYRALTTEEEADAEDVRAEFNAESFYNHTSEEDLFEREAQRLETRLREEVERVAPPEFAALPWRWTETPEADDDYDFDSCDEGTRCEVAMSVVPEAIRRARRPKKASSKGKRS